ncbi:MAG: hypothetical protein J6K96_03425 [Treponema sp.]|nr:hypothetical protein [Treponema sp.]
MRGNECWLPSIIEYDGNSGWEEYDAQIYSIYKQDFIDSKPVLHGKTVTVKHYPKIHEYEESYIHITCKNYDGTKNRDPDLRRCERIKWVRAFLEHYDCKKECTADCSGIKVWKEPYHSKDRIHFLFEEEKYMVVVEDRKRFYLLITAFYFDYPHALERELKKYGRYKTGNAIF